MNLDMQQSVEKCSGCVGDLFFYFSGIFGGWLERSTKSVSTLAFYIKATPALILIHIYTETTQRGRNDVMLQEAEVRGARSTFLDRWLQSLIIIGPIVNVQDIITDTTFCEPNHLSLHIDKYPLNKTCSIFIL